MQNATYMGPAPGGFYDRSHAVVPSFTNRLDCQTDEELVGKCRENNRAAFDALLKRYEGPIYNFAYKLAGNRDDALDLAAEAGFRIYRAFATLRNPIALPAWINRIIANAFFDTRRRVERSPTVSLDAMIEETGDRFVPLENAWTLSPQAHAEASERASILNHAIDTLPNNQRQLVRLFHHQDHTYEEIANALRIPVGTVKSRLSRARLALRELLAPQMSSLMS